MKRNDFGGQSQLGRWPLRSRREVLKQGAAVVAALSTAGLPRFAIAAKAPVKVGLLLPYTGVYAKLGENITDGFMMRLQEAGNKLGGREIEFTKVDDEANPAKAVDNTTKLVKGKRVDFVIGTVHSGVAAAMVKVIEKSPKTIMICPNAGNNDMTRDSCGPNIFRTSFSNWQTCYPMGPEVAKRGHKKIVSVTWKYAAGQQMMDAFFEGFRKAGGGEPLEQIWIPFEDVEFQAVLTKIAALKPDAVFSFFSGGGAVKFVKDYAAALDRRQIPLYGPGFLTEGTLEAQGAAAEGIVTTLHWADTLDLPANRKFLADFKAKTGRTGDVFGVQGYDTGTLLLKAMAAVGGDTGATKQLIAAMEDTVMTDSPRGTWRMSKAHNPVQDFYLRRVEQGRNTVLGVAIPQLDDPATGCKL